MIQVLKALCLLLYVAAAAVLLGIVPAEGPILPRLPRVAGIVLVIHALEAVVMLRHVRRYPGPLAVSLLLTLLFGLLHWKPLADRPPRSAEHG